MQTCRECTGTKTMAGLDVLERIEYSTLAGAQVGLVVNQASVNERYEHAIDLFARSEKLELRSIFGPQHGLFGTTQDNMIEWQGFRHPTLQIPVYSLYGQHRKPTDEMLDGIDTLVIDLPDVGARYYTFIWTAKLCLEACAAKKIRLVVLDRPNPIGGSSMEGPLMNKKYFSFVGLHNIPIRHAMTMGELLNMINEEDELRCHLDVVKMYGWHRGMFYRDTGLPWVLPSPNMPTAETAMVYPGGCLLEATNISEGRGTCLPFEICGAPFIDPERLKAELDLLKLPGVLFRPLFFQPTFNKYAGETCGGVQIHVLNRQIFRPVRTYTALINIMKKLYPGSFQWKNPPYEYEMEKIPIDILWGDSSLRDAVDSGEQARIEGLEAKMHRDVQSFLLRWERYLLYETNQALVF